MPLLKLTCTTNNTALLLFSLGSVLGVNRKSQATTPVKSARLGRDEMNLAELPFFLLSKRSPKGVSEVEFTYDIRSAGETVRTHLTIQGDPRHGLPTTREEDVVLACLQLSRDSNDYEDPKVYFTQRQLLQELQWGTRGDAYKRLEDAFFCIQGARYRGNGWRDNEKKIYTSKGAFTLISDFMLRDSRRKDAAANGHESDDTSLSYFVWGQTLYESFRHGYLKTLDYQLVSGFKTTLSKRLYRYLDKHFNPPHFMQVTLPLKPFAYERMAMSRKADLYEIQRQMKPAIEELTAVGFLEPASWKERTKKVGTEWQISFCRSAIAAASIATCGQPESKTASAIPQLVARGVDLTMATTLAAKLKVSDQDAPYTTTRLRYIIDLHDFKKQNNKRCGPGFLVEGLRRVERFPPDDGFSVKSTVERPSVRKTRRTTRRSPHSVDTLKLNYSRAQELSDDEQRELERAALERQPAAFHRSYEEFRRTSEARFTELRAYLIADELQKREQ